MNEKINIGIAGYGKMGEIREQTISNNNNANLISIFDSSKEIYNKDWIVCSSYEELLNSDIDAVFICAYVNVAAEYTLRALKAGKHVFCEKPPAMSADELKEINEYLLESDQIIKYGFNHRFHHSVIKAKKLIDSGSMGRPLWMRGVYGKAGSLDFSLNWRSYKKYAGGGILMDQGIHMLDLFRYFLGEEMEPIATHIDSLFWPIESEDNAFLILKSETGIISTLHSSATQWRHKFLLEMTFENGYINLDGILSSTGSYSPEKLLYAYREEENIDVAMGKPSENIIHFESDDSWDFELKEFLDAIQGVTEVRNGTAHDAYKIMKLLDSIYAYK